MIMPMNKMPPTIHSFIGNNIKLLRKEKGLTEKELARYHAILVLVNNRFLVMSKVLIVSILICLLSYQTYLKSQFKL